MAEPLLQRIERYYDATPRTAARVERIGPFDVFIKVGSGWSYYARPALGATEFSAGDVERVRARQRELDVPESFEWIAETSPRLRAAVEAGGLHVHVHPLLALEGEPSKVDPPGGIDLRLATADDDLRRIGAVVGLAFASPGTSVGTEGIAELEAAVQRRAADSVEFERERLRSGLTVSAVAFLDGEPVGAGSHQPVGSVSEIVGVATLPVFRRQGIASALTALLVDDARRRGVTTVFLSAGDDTIARVYERVGFRRIGTACIAEPASASAIE